jgi:type IV pilus assembly protein PilX
MNSVPARQRGITLIVVMIFLVLITLFSVSAIRASSSNLRLTQNMMVRQEGLGAAQAAIEDAISTPAFQAASAATPTTANVDTDGDGSTDYAVTVTPADTCSAIRTLKNVELPRDTATGLPSTAWIRCDSGSGGAAAGSGSGGAGLIEGGSAPAVSGLSYCVETHWNVRGAVDDARTGVRVEVNQGVAVPYSVGESQDRCKRNN